MKRILFFIFMFFVSWNIQAQDKFFSAIPVISTVDGSFYLLTTEGGRWKKFDVAALQQFLTPTIEASPILYTPTASGNTSNLNQFVTDPEGDLYFIDFEGRSQLFSSDPGGGGAGNIEFVDDYDELRSYVGTADAIIVKDFSYTFNSKSYTTRGGLFLNDACTENGGTCISGVWKRVWNGSILEPEWWEVGGRDHEGNAYSSQNTGIHNEADRLYAASAVGNHGSTILFEKNKTYDGIDRYIPAYRGQTFEMQNAFLKMTDPITTTLGANFTSGGTTITVANSAGFRRHQQIVIKTGHLSSENTANTQAAPIITSVAGNVITVNAAINVSYTAGDSVIVASNMFQSVSNDHEYTWWKNGTLDMNGAIYAGYHGHPAQIRSWKVLKTVAGGNSSRLKFTNMKFLHTVSSNVQTSNVIMEDCRYQGLAGGLVHLTTSIRDSSFQTVFKNVTGDTSNILSQADMGHESALITFSVGAFNILVDGCIFRYGVNTDGGHIFGVADLTAPADGEVKILNSKFYNFTKIARWNPGTAGFLSGLYIRGCEFHSCGDLDFNAQADFRKGIGTENINISDNIFINTRFDFSDCFNIKMHDNVIFYRTNYQGFTTYTGGVTSTNDFVAVNFRRIDRIDVSNNIISADSIYNSNLQWGIQIRNDQSTSYLRRDASGNHTDWYYAQHLNISNNTIVGFKFGIGPGNDINATQSYSYADYTISNNKITSLRGSAEYTYGIIAPPGSVVTDNSVWMLSTNTTSKGIIALGIDSTKTNLPGSFIRDNMVYAPASGATAIHLGGSVLGAGKHAWITCVGNIYTGLFVDNIDTAKKLISSNHDIGTMPGFAPEVPELRYFLEHASEHY